jgi:hypothetical protein
MLVSIIGLASFVTVARFLVAASEEQDAARLASAKVDTLTFTIALGFKVKASVGTLQWPVISRLLNHLRQFDDSNCETHFASLKGSPFWYPSISVRNAFARVVLFWEVANSRLRFAVSIAPAKSPVWA